VLFKIIFEALGDSLKLAPDPKTRFASPSAAAVTGCVAVISEAHDCSTGFYLGKSPSAIF
jgi:hypothetical protein